MEFIKGLELCEGFFFDIAKPILDWHLPDLIYTAGLIGYGSDVLGYDDEVSTDHMWGPRFYLFIKEEDLPRKPYIMNVFGSELPYTYKGYSVNFSEPDPNDNGVRHPEIKTEGPVSPLIFIQTFEDFLSGYLGTAGLDNLSDADWLSFSEHRLLALTSGRIFTDGLDLRRSLDKLHFYPEDVRLYLIASNWSLIAEEQAFVRRCFDVGDDLGSSLVCGRIADRLMRLAFLYCGKYAPYSKWFGTAFARLPINDKIKSAIREAVAAADITQREDNIVMAQKLMADLHNAFGLTDYVDVHIETYFERKIKVIYADKIADAVLKRISDAPCGHYPLIGSLSGAANFTNIFDNPACRENVKSMYDHN